ncbi:MAG: hypothetical protein HRU24_10820 [Gammaproteobacteria bacterium]|nr:hypothetical protein [Gammaproteobacteria bacterium]
MSNFKSIFIATTAIFFMQACGGGSKSTTTPEVIAPEPAVVHNLQPDKVPEYIANFKQSNAQVVFEFDGELSKIEFYQAGPDNMSVIATYESGFINIGLDINDFNNLKPIASLSVHETDANGVVEEEYASSNIEVSVQGDNFVYSGTVIDEATQGLFNVRVVINASFFNAGNSTVTVEGTKALVNGTLGTKTYIQIDELINNNPEVTTLELQLIDGSINDDINMHTGRLIRKAQLTTFIPATGDVNSGGVDLFAAGFKREYETGGKVGVHSWFDGIAGKAADSLSKDDPAHGAQLTYFREMLGNELGPKFYFFTINAAPAESVHVMTQSELTQYLISQ